MKHLFAAILALTMALTAVAQETAVTTAGKNVTIASRGSDVRAVIHDLFTQSEKNYILDPTIRFTLYLSLKDVEFDEALQIILKTASLKCDLQNGIYYVGRVPKPAIPDPKVSQGKPAETKGTTGAKTSGKPEAETIKPKGPIKSTELQKRVTTRYNKVDLRTLMEDLGKQTGIPIVVNEKVPQYKVDAFLINTSLKYALDQICSAAGLRYKLTEHGGIELIPNVSLSTDNESKGGSKESGSAKHP